MDDLEVWEVMAGKGDNPRPVDREKFSAGWDRTFKGGGSPHDWEWRRLAKDLAESRVDDGREDREELDQMPCAFCDGTHHLGLCLLAKDGQ